MAMYGELYPEAYTFKYPKAGESNSLVEIYIYDLLTGANRKVAIPQQEETYVPRIKWTQSSNGLCVMAMNRHQNNLKFYLTDLAGQSRGDVKVSMIYEESSATYIDINDNLYFLKDGKSFLWNSERDGYNHIWLFSLDPNVKPRQITSGAWDVIEFYGVDEKNGIVFYASSEVSALESHLYAKGITKRFLRRLSSRKGHNEAVFSKTFDYYINYHSDANTPYYITMNDREGKEIRVLKDNAALKATVDKYRPSRKEFFTFNNREGIALNCWMIKPEGFNPEKKYPVLVAIYGGPGHNTVVDAWEGKSYLWHQMLASMGYVVVSCDPRGTQYRGREFKHATYQQLGKLETEDFIDFAKHLQGLPFVNPDRIGMQGWSYGGYMTSLCMTKGADFYKAGIAVAPVTNWRYYDTIYTERFMRTPQENPEGYDDNSPINHVEKLKGSFLLVHGSADDNVHYQNAELLLNELIKYNKQFQFMPYPNRTHSISEGEGTSVHLQTLYTNYLKTYCPPGGR
jgi:dipeptidyl-peptidase-4